MREAAAGYRDKMIEALADHDEQIMELYLEGKSAESRTAIRAAVRTATLKIEDHSGRCWAPPSRNKGVQPMLDAVVDYLPSPLDLPPVIGNGRRRQGKEGRAMAAR